MASISSSMSIKHGISLWCPQSPSLDRRHSSVIYYRSFHRRNFVVSASSSFANENREFVIVGGGNAAGYATRTFVEQGMADGKLCIVSKELVMEMLLDMQLGLSSNKGWLMESSVLFPKRTLNCKIAVFLPMQASKLMEAASNGDFHHYCNDTVINNHNSQRLLQCPQSASSIVPSICRRANLLIIILIFN
ncbi:hypothetical protein L6452_31610 [Arctium lappa]|uniref:Uncharacterized protein n=1 Tax=Arctium lappa TaxID=4217 RepID=A0ACB8Z2L6_ARCLA|nr:hypothetical protein L6452_31610 [Arctium lappa]